MMNTNKPKKENITWPSGAKAYVYCLKAAKYKFISCNLGDIYKCLYCVPIAIK